jgi:hypothetical protein
MVEETTALGGVSNGDQPQSDWRDDVTARVSVEVKQLERRCEALEALLVEARAEHRQALAVLKTANPEMVPAKRKKKEKVASDISERVRVGLAGGILRVKDPERFTLLEVHHDVLGSPWSEANSYVAMKTLRNQELVGKGVKDPQSKRQTWRILDRQALETLAKQAEG